MDPVELLKLSILILTVLINSLFILVVFVNNPRSATNIIFSVLNVVTSIWLVVSYVGILPTLSSSSLLLSRLSIFLAVPQIISFYLLSKTLPHDRIGIPRNKLLILLLLGVLVMGLTISPFAFTSVKSTGDSLQPVPGWGIAPFTLFALVLSGGAIFTLVRRISQEVGVVKQQLKFVMFGILAMLSLIIVTILIPIALFSNTFFVHFTPVYALIFLGLTTYAIVKHRLLDIRLLVARAVAYSIMITIISVFFVTPTFYISSYLLGLNIEFSQVVIYTILTVLVALSFQRLRILTEKFTDKYFFKGQYEPDELLASLAHVMSSEIDLHQLTHDILNTLITQMRVTKAAFVLLKGQAIYDLVEIGYGNQLQSLHFPMTKFLDQDQTVIFDEQEEGEVKKIMRDSNIIVSHTLKVKGEIIGLLLLGEKASGEIYSAEDLRIIEILAPEVSVAIQNSLSFDEIKKFNITLKQEVEKATFDLQTANQKLEDLDKLKDDFVSVASHELRTPMTAIRSYAWMALNRSDTVLSERVKKYLTRVLISTERLINLVNDMLNISRIESGKIEIKPRVFDPQALVKDIITELTPKAMERGIQLVCSESKVPQVFADPEKVYQVVLNIVGNALKFTPEKGLVQVSFFTDGQMVDVSTKDSGVGIDKADLSSLFQKFGRLDNSYVAAATSGGTGLGLYICKSLVEMMKGKIWASSEGMGKGTTMTFSLPIANTETLSKSQEFTYIPPTDSKQLEPVAVV